MRGRAWPDNRQQTDRQQTKHLPALNSGLLSGRLLSVIQRVFSQPLDPPGEPRRPRASSSPARALGSVLPLLLLAGCVHLSQPAPQIRDYRLDYAPPVPVGTPVSATLRVAPFGVAAVYDREAIVYRDDLYSTGRYFYHRWSSNPGDMVADLLARDLADSRLYRAVQQGPSPLPSDYQLSGEIEEIEERPATSACTAHLRLRITLARISAGAGVPTVLQSTYSADEPCPCNDARALAEAMSRGLAGISAQLQQQVYDGIAADLAPVRTRTGRS